MMGREGASEVFVQSLRERRKALFWWCAGTVLYLLLVSSAFPTFKGQEKALQDLLESYPDALMALFGMSRSTDMFAPAGYLQTQAMGVYVPLLFIILGVGYASRAIAGEERTGELDLLLSLPLSRGSLLAQRAASLFVQLAVLAAAIYVGMQAGALVFGMDISPLNLAAGAVSGLLLGMAFGTLALALGAATGRKGLATVVTAVVALATFLLDSLSELIGWLDELNRLSPFYWYGANQPLMNGLRLGDVAVLVSISVVCVVVGTLVFDRRDLAV